MRKMTFNRTVLCSIAALALVAAGCAQEKKTADQPQSQAGGGQTPQVAAAAEAHNLHGWWCTEHGVPEEECTRCDASLIPTFKENGDWCEKHNRPDSQCFICHPELEEKFAARFEAKFGKKPPRPAE